MENKNELAEIVKTVSTEQDVEKTKSDLKIFLVAQAKRELERVISLTRLLDNVEDKYGEAVNKYLYDNPDMIVQVAPSIMETIITSLDRSNELIKQVLGNEKLFDILIVDQSKSVSVNVANSLEDAKSRSRVISSVNRIMDMIKQDEIYGEVVEEKTDEENK